jgi:hypothetical protein
MDFYNRKKIYLLTAIILLILIPIVYLIFTTTSPGLEIDANLILEPSPNLVVHINNTSSHTIDNLQVFLNNELMFDLNTLDANKSLTLEYPALTEKLDLLILAHNQLGYEKTFSLDKSALNNTELRFKPIYAFQKAGNVSDINLTICNDSNNVNLNVDLILDDGELKSGKTTDNIDLEKDQCKLLQYNILYVTTGDKKVKFKIYNDVYNRELLISGTVN